MSLTAFAFVSPTAAGWVPYRSETFDGVGALADGERLGEQGWLVAVLRNSGLIELQAGEARFSTPDFPDSALLRVFDPLPEVYRLRVRVGLVDYGYGNYEPSDFTDPAFKYNRLGGSSLWVENGFYWLTLTDRLIEPDSGEDWWHRWRKLVVDSDDHLDGNGTVHTERPLYMVYMNPALDRSTGDWTGGLAELLRTWSGGVWHTGTWNWEVAFQYASSAWYVVELDKTPTAVTMRVFDDAGTPIELADPVPLDLVFGMGAQASALEYAWVGEPHVDSYEGSARVDEIELLVDDATDSDGDGVLDPTDSCLVRPNAAQTDRDGDGRGDACDIDDGLIVVEPSRASVSWQAEVGFDTWNLYRGNLATLRTSGTYTVPPGIDPLVARHCGLSTTTLDDAFVPPPSDAVFYLVAGVAGSFEGDLGTDGQGSPRPNPAPCPPP